MSELETEEIASVDRASLERMWASLSREDRALLARDPTEQVAESIVEAVIRRRAMRRATNWHRRRRSAIAAESEGRHQVEERLARSPWGDALDALDLQISATRRAGHRHAVHQWHAFQNQQDARFEALRRLHLRAMLVASEIAVLLWSGHASGANARWRTLHEIATVSSFIANEDQLVAERYLLHRNIELSKSIEAFRQAGPPLADELPEDAELAELGDVVKELIGRFGRDYRNRFGWAASVLGMHNPGLRDLEGHLEVSHWRPWVDMANHAVHAGARASHWDLGMPDENGPVSFPTGFGLASPGQATTLSLQLSSRAFLGDRLDFNSWIDSAALSVITEWARQRFLEGESLMEEWLQSRQEQADGPRKRN